MKLIDLTGKKFCRLTVLRRIEDYVDEKTGRHYVQWECQCSCEEKTIINVLGDNLRNGNVKSCGCLRSENLKKIRKENSKDNVYDLSGEYGIGWTTNTNKEFILIWKIMIRLKIIVGMTMGIMQQLYLMVIIVFSCRTLL